MAYSYWNEYQRALKENKELEKALQEKDYEISALKLQIEQLEGSCKDTKAIYDADKGIAYQMEIDKLQHEINKLNEQLYMEQQKYEQSKVNAHTMVINAINEAFN